MNKGVISFSDDLVITSGYTFEQFRNTRYYKERCDIYAVSSLL